MYNYAKLKGRIVEVCGTQMNFANAMGMSERTCSLKLQDKVDFKQSEISKAVDVLGLDASDIASYFFTV